MKFTKNNKIYDYQVKNGHVICTVYDGNSWIMNPAISKLLEIGYTEVEEPEIVESEQEEQFVEYKPNYEELVEQYIRENGYPDYGYELAIINNYTVDPDKYKQVWKQYQKVRQDAKDWAAEQLEEGQS